MWLKIPGIKKTKRTLPGCSSDFSRAKVRRTSSAVARSAGGPEGFSASTFSFLASNPYRLVNASRRSDVHWSNCFAYSSSPLAPLMITANLFGSIWASVGLGVTVVCPHTTDPSVKESTRLMNWTVMTQLTRYTSNNFQVGKGTLSPPLWTIQLTAGTGSPS